MHTPPPAPTATIAALATVCPGAKLMFDVAGMSCPHGKTVTYPAASGLVTVTFSETAAASAGTAPVPATCTSLTDRAESRRGEAVLRSAVEAEEARAEP